MRRLAIALIALLPPLASASAQDMAADPADVEAVKAVMRKAAQAMVQKDAKGFMACCDVYVDCYFYDGTLVKGTKRIEKTLAAFFDRRPAGSAIKLDVVPRSHRVLSPDIITVDWPATIQGPSGAIKVNTLTTVRKVDGRWSITSFLESVPYTPPGSGPSRD